MKSRVFSWAAATMLCSPAASQAAPYASAVTVTGDNVSFILNESADTVKVVFNGGPTTITIGTTPEPAGLKNFSKAGFTSFRIEVEKKAGPGWKSGVLQQISQDTNDLVKFANGRGVAINRFPNTGPLFGRIYTSVATTGNAAPVVDPPTPPRSTAEGIYVLNADFSATALGSGALTGGLTFDTTATGAEGPYRLTVGAGGDLFITDWSDTNGSVFKTNSDVSGGKNVLGGPIGLIAPATTNFPLGTTRIHGSIAAVVTEGSEATNDLKLWVIDEDLQSNPDSTTQSIRNSIWQWDMAGEPLPMVNPPALFTGTSGPAGTRDAGIGFASQTSDLCRSSDGTFYKLQRRAAPAITNNGESGIFAINAEGTPIPSFTEIATTGSRDAFRAYSGNSTALDPFVEAGACDISEDNWLAVLRRSDNAIHLVRASMGIIDFSSHILLYPAPTTTTARDIAFDMAGNLYTISSGQALLRVYSPGGHTKATTSSAGTFEIVEVTPTPAAASLALPPVINSVTRTGDDLIMPFTSRLGIPGTLFLQRTSNLEAGPWETSTTAVFPAAQFTITGTPPNFTFTAIGAFTANPPYFYRVLRR